MRILDLDRARGTLFLEDPTAKVDGVEGPTTLRGMAIVGTKEVEVKHPEDGAREITRGATLASTSSSSQGVGGGFIGMASLG